MCVYWRDLMFAQKVGKIFACFPFNPIHALLFLSPSNKRRLKVRYKRFSIRQLIWIFIRREKNTDKHFLSFFVLERFRSLFPFRLLDFYYRRDGSACIDFSRFFHLAFRTRSSQTDTDKVFHINQFGFCFVLTFSLHFIYVQTKTFLQHFDDMYMFG